MHFQFELMSWGDDGTPYLYYEDFIHGEDIVIALQSDGAFHCIYGADEPVRTKIDLVQFLRSLLEEETARSNTDDGG